MRLAVLVQLDAQLAVGEQPALDTQLSGRRPQPPCCTRAKPNEGTVASTSTALLPSSPATSCVTPAGGCRRQRHKLAALPRERVPNGERCTLSDGRLVCGLNGIQGLCELLQGLLCNCPGSASHLVELRVAVDIHLLHAAAGQDIVELVQQQQAPGRVELRLLVVLPRSSDRPGVEPLGFAQQQLGRAVGLFGAALAGVGAAMIFEIQLA